MTLRGLDNYIMGVNLSHYEMVDHECRFCGRKWQANMLYDMGGWFYKNDDDAFCPDCSMEYKGGEYYKNLACSICKVARKYEGENLLNHLWFFHKKRVNTGINELFDQAVKRLVEKR